MTGWTEDRIDAAERLWRNGWTATQIAGSQPMHGSGLSRNAVIGLAHRRGWSKGSSRTPTDPPPPPVRKPGTSARAIYRRSHARLEGRRLEAQGRAEATLPPPLPTQTASSSPVDAAKALRPQTITFDQLETGLCRWPLGPWLAPAELFCGATVPETWLAGPDGGKRLCVYCPEHFAIAYTAPVSRRRYHHREYDQRRGSYVR